MSLSSIATIHVNELAFIYLLLVVILHYFFLFGGHYKEGDMRIKREKRRENKMKQMRT